MISHKFEGLTNGETYYAKVFTANPNGRVNNREDVPAVSCVPSSFPGEPTEYVLIETYTAATTFTAPEDGYFRIEAFGASGNGGTAAHGRSYDDSDGSYWHYGGTGGGGGGGGAAISEIMMNKGDTLVITIGAVGAITSVVINSSLETYNTLSVTSGTNGTNAGRSTSTEKGSAGKGGTGGVSSGGNQGNYTGGSGSDGKTFGTWSSNTSYSSGIGGTAGYTGGNVGGNGEGVRLINDTPNYTTRAFGKAGFVKIYRGNTNVVA